MLKGALIAAAGVLAVAVFATATNGPEALAAARKCKQPGTNKYVACTNKLTTKTRRQKMDLKGASEALTGR
jgi:hypothetical protein